MNIFLKTAKVRVREFFSLSIIILGLIFVSSCEKTKASNQKALKELSKIESEDKKIESEKEKYTPINWKELVPLKYRNNETLSKLQQKLAAYGDYDTEAIKIYEDFMEGYMNAPAEPSLEGKEIRLAGFIAPLELNPDGIKEFLLVPYFGACIHNPPPPVNQTVLVKVKSQGGIRFEDIYRSYTIGGKIKVLKQATEIGTAGYLLEDAVVF